MNVCMYNELPLAHTHETLLSKAESTDMTALCKSSSFQSLLTCIPSLNTFSREINGVLPY